MSDSNKLVGLDSLSSLAKQLKANIKEDLLGDKKLRYVTLDEYEALSDTEKNNNSIVWNIIDADDLILNDFSTQVDWNETDPESPKYILNKPNLDDALLGELDFSTLEFDTTVIVFDSSYVPLSEPDIPDVPTPPEPEVELSSISASYTGGQVEVGTPISSLKNLTVTAWYINDTSEVITNYTITEGNIVEGRNIIEVSYQGKTATFEVTGYIEQVELASISVSYTGGQVKVGTPISSLGNITVKAWYTNDTSKDITDYTIVTEGNIAEGENIIEVIYQGKTATFKVTGYTTSVNDVQVKYDGGNKEYGTVTIEDLRPYLTVTAYYSDGSNEVVTDYEIIGELKKRENTLTVSYRGKTNTFFIYLDVKIHTIIINSVPFDGPVIKINGVVINWVNAESGDTITYEVSCPGYITQTGEITVTGDETITVTLVKIPEYTITYVYRNMDGADIKDSTSEVVQKGTSKTFSTSDAPIIEGYTIESVNPTSATITDKDITVVYRYTPDKATEGGEGDESGDLVWYTNLAEASPRNEISGNNTGAYFYSTPSTIASYVGRPINMIKLQPAASGKLSYGYYSATEFEELGFITLEGASDTLVEYRVQEFTLEEGQNFWIFKPAGESGRFRYGTSKAVEGAECRRNLNSSAEPGTNEGEQVGYLPSLGVDLGYTTEEMSEPEQVFDGWYTDFAIKGSPNAQISANQGMLAYTNPNTIALYVGKPINRLRFMTNNSGVVNYGKFKYDSNGVPTEIIPLGTVSSGGYSSEPVEYEIETFTLVEGENFWIFDSVGGGNDAYLRICTGTSTGNSEFNANIKLGSKGNTLHGGGSNLLVDFGFHGTF